MPATTTALLPSAQAMADNEKIEPAPGESRPAGQILRFFNKCLRMEQKVSRTKSSHRFTYGLTKPSQVPRPSCVEGRENEGSKTAEFFFIGRLWKKFSWKVGKGAHNWNRQHVNSNFFSDDPSISQLGAAVEPLFSLRPIFHFPSANFPLLCSAFFNWISLQIIFYICFPLSNCMC